MAWVPSRSWRSEPTPPQPISTNLATRPRFRDECLNENWFLDLADARQIIEAWRPDYNSSRPHSALVYATPQEFAASQQGHAPAEMTPAPTTGTISNQDSRAE
jgi:transposase InsO family protein